MAKYKVFFHNDVYRREGAYYSLKYLAHQVNKAWNFQIPSTLEVEYKQGEEIAEQEKALHQPDKLYIYGEIPKEVFEELWPKLLAQPFSWWESIKTALRSFFSVENLTNPHTFATLTLVTLVLLGLAPLFFPAASPALSLIAIISGVAMGASTLYRVWAWCTAYCKGEASLKDEWWSFSIKNFLKEPRNLLMLLALALTIGALVLTVGFLSSGSFGFMSVIFDTIKNAFDLCFPDGSMTILAETITAVVFILSPIILAHLALRTTDALAAAKVAGYDNPESQSQMLHDELIAAETAAAKTDIMEQLNSTQRSTRHSLKKRLEALETANATILGSLLSLDKNLQAIAAETTAAKIDIMKQLKVIEERSDADEDECSSSSSEGNSQEKDESSDADEDENSNSSSPEETSQKKEEGAIQTVSAPVLTQPTRETTVSQTTVPQGLRDTANVAKTFAFGGGGS